MTADTENVSFEDAMRELESIVRDLETGKSNLDDAINADQPLLFLALIYLGIAVPIICMKAH